MLTANRGQCELKVTLPSGETWKAKVDLKDGEAEGMLRGLLVHMVRTNDLRKEEVPRKPLATPKYYFSFFKRVFSPLF